MRRYLPIVRFPALLIVTVLGGASLAAAPAKSPAPKHAGTFTEQVAPFLAKNCVMCHNGKMKSGNLDLKIHSTPDQALKDREVWDMVVRKVRTGEMPPKGLPKPSIEDIERVSGWIEGEYDRLDSLAKPDPGRVTARRLNRYEYNATIRDLVGVDLKPADGFPADDSGYGFDNIADVLSLSPVLMEKYLAAAEKIARTAIVAEPSVFKPTRIQLKAEAALMGEHLKVAPLKPNAQGPVPAKTAFHSAHKFPAEAEYEIKIGVGGVRPEPYIPVKMTLWIDGKAGESFEVNPKGDSKRQFEVRVPLTAGEHRLSAAFVDDPFLPENAPIKPRDRYLAIDSFEIRGPYAAVATPLPASHKLLIACGHAQGQHQNSCARTNVSSLARRAFRRPPSEAEVDKLTNLVALAEKDGETFEGGMRLALQAVLVSPHFLFRIERDPDPANPDAEHKLNPYELASRLSYFLWSSMPDDELLAAADSGRLAEKAVLAKQVHRMLADPKSNALAENFAGQWLHLRNLDEAKPDPDRYPAFDDELRRAMKRETELFFQAVVRENRSILDFLDSGFTFLNDRLALHYGIPGVEGSEFRRVALSGGQRGGILGQGSVLTVSSYPTRTSPVIRGKWVLENILNSPPPPPPDDVPNLDEEAVGNTGSLRQQLEKHRSNAVCASCHSRMDPLGFGLENYDAIGAWRTVDGKFPVDASGTLPSGQSFTKPHELKAILKDNKDEFSRCVVEKLMTYALGRALQSYDRRTIQSINRSVATGGYRFESLVTNIVTSLPFQMRRGEAPKTSKISSKVEEPKI